jgi:hypothetical protein
MAEITPSGVIVTGAPTDVRANAQLPGTRDVLENIYNDFLDAKQQGKVELGLTFDTWIRNSIEMLEQHRKREIFEQFSMGQIGKAEYEALEEYRAKLVVLLKKSDPSFWDFDQYGIQYIQSDQRHLFRERVGNKDMVVPDRRPVQIKTSSSGKGIIG